MRLIDKKFPAHLFVSSTDGSLHDTRLKSWHTQKPVRAIYSRNFGTITTLAELKATLRYGPFAWPGGYPIYLVTTDGAALCFECARKEFRQIVWDFQHKASTGWRVCASTINYEDQDLQCEHCNKRIDPAYGE